MSVLHPLGTPFIELTVVDSSNNYAMQQIKAGLVQHGTAWFAHEQTAGKGQRGKTWFTEQGQNIIISIAVDTKQLNTSQQFEFSMAMALGCYDFFSGFALPDDTKIKWPNDIYWRDRKAAGILIENVFQGNDWTWAVVGIGMNINQTQFSAAMNAVSLKQITGKTYDVPAMAVQLCQALEKRWVNFIDGADLLTAYNDVLYKRQQTVRLKKQNIAFDCVVESVSNQGKLMVSGSTYTSFEFGEVQWMIN